MILDFPEAKALRVLTPDARLLFATRIIRLFAFGLISITLVLYLRQMGLSEAEVGLLTQLRHDDDRIFQLPDRDHSQQPSLNSET
jgi:hypothetical protein